MKRMLIIISILAMNIAYSQLYDSFDIPTYTYRTAQLNGDPMIKIESVAGESTTDMSFGGKYDFESQSPAMSYSYGATLDYESDGDGAGPGEGTSDWDISVPFSVNKYFADSRGVFGFASGTLLMRGGDQVPDGSDDTGDLNMTIGAGYGRVISARPVAQAAAIAGELGGASNAAILEMASIISKGNSGWYTNEHKDNAMVEYYNDLAAASGNSSAAMKIIQITTNPIYQISNRWTGWEVKAGLTNNYMQEDGDDSGDLSLLGRYAMVMGDDAQVMASFGYDKDMNDGGGNSMSLGCTYTIDHNYNWATSAAFSYVNNTGAEVGGVTPDAVATMGLSVNTSKSIINQLTGTAGFSYGKVGDNDASTTIEARLTYYLF